MSELLSSFKNRMHISHSSEDAYLRDILRASFEDIVSKCGQFNLESNYRGRELVMERSRYVYNDAVEYFNDNFLSQIHSFGINNLPDEVDEDVSK
ncbi:phage head-tail connector protein [Alkalihalobacillus sp. FSL R5-0424]